MTQGLLVFPPFAIHALIMLTTAGVIGHTVTSTFSSHARHTHHALLSRH